MDIEDSLDAFYFRANQFEIQRAFDAWWNNPSNGERIGALDEYNDTAPEDMSRAMPVLRNLSLTFLSSYVPSPLFASQGGYYSDPNMVLGDLTTYALYLFLRRYFARMKAFSSVSQTIH